MNTFVEQVEARLRVALQRDVLRGALRDAAEHLCLAPGAKRMRPLLVKHFGEALGLPQAPLVDIAVAAELIHAASLLHDDVIDDAATRRGRPSVNVAWSNITAVLAGDMLLTLAFLQIQRLPKEITTGAVETVAQMTRAIMLEVEARSCVDMGLPRWHEIAEGKTARLFAWCGEAVARAAHAEAETVARFASAGFHLGIAFQAADDLHDLLGGAGKPRFADLVNRQPSLPIVLACARDAMFAAAWARGDDAVQMGTYLLASEAWNESVDVVVREIGAATGALAQDVDTAGGRAILDWTTRLRESLHHA